VHLVLEDRVGRARRQAEAAVHAVLDQLRFGRVLLEIPGGAHSPPTKVPGRKIRAGSNRAFRRSITTWLGPGSGHWSPTREAPSRTVHARGETAWRVAATRSARSSPGAKAIHESPSAARETTVASPAARITF